MATIGLLRTCTGARCILLKPQLLQRSVPCLVQKNDTNKVFSTSNQSNMIEYFRARRGPFTPAEKQHGHKMLASTHWKVERVVAVSMLGIMPAAIYFQGPYWDAILSTTVLMHGFWGVDGVLTDYIEKFFPPVHYFWYALSILGLAGLLHFNYNDVGVTKAVSLVWSLKS